MSFFLVKLWIFVCLALFRHNGIVTWIILFTGAKQTVHTCRTAALHAILSFLVSLFASYDPQSHKILQFYCFQILLNKKGGAMAPCPPGFASPVKQDREKGRAMFHTCIKLFSPTPVYVCIYYISGGKWSTIHITEISQEQERVNIYAIMKKMCRPCDHISGFDLPYSHCGSR